MSERVGSKMKACKTWFPLGAVLLVSVFLVWDAVDIMEMFFAGIGSPSSFSGTDLLLLACSLICAGLVALIYVTLLVLLVIRKRNVGFMVPFALFALYGAIDSVAGVFALIVGIGQSWFDGFWTVVPLSLRALAGPFWVLSWVALAILLLVRGENCGGRKPIWVIFSIVSDAWAGLMCLAVGIAFVASITTSGAIMTYVTTVPGFFAEYHVNAMDQGTAGMPEQSIGGNGGNVVIVPGEDFDEIIIGGGFMPGVEYEGGLDVESETRWPVSIYPGEDGDQPVIFYPSEDGNQPIIVYPNEDGNLSFVNPSDGVENGADKVPIIDFENGESSFGELDNGPEYAWLEWLAVAMSLVGSMLIAPLMWVIGRFLMLWFVGRWILDPYVPVEEDVPVEAEA